MTSKRRRGIDNRFFFFFFPVHSFNPVPSLVPLFPFIFFPLYFPLNQGFDVVKGFRGGGDG